MGRVSTATTTTTTTYNCRRSNGGQGYMKCKLDGDVAKCVFLKLLLLRLLYNYKIYKYREIDLVKDITVARVRERKCECQDLVEISSNYCLLRLWLYLIDIMMMQVAFVVIIILIIIELLYIYRWLLRLGSGQIAHTWIQSSSHMEDERFIYFLKLCEWNIMS